ncbi:hypothetical protein ABZX77_46535 [Streptomyces sp. NPDC004237]|uniref:hypothetical protein n=1 Tax=Streptomyces sp. NPDC004237 TaxID=3154455 RepID=UPI0033BECA0A
MQRRTLLLLTAGLLMATTAGCAAEAAAPVPSGGGSRRPSGNPERTLHLAEQLLIKSCMEKQGYRYWIEPWRPVDAVHRFPYVVDDAAWAEAHGYGNDLSRERETEALRDPNQKYFRATPADRRAALLSAINGPRPQGLSTRLPTGLLVTHSDRGCVADAERELYQDLPGWFRVTRVGDSLSAMRVDLVLGDKDYRAATRPWSVCMRGRGFSYRSPAEARAAATEPGRTWPHSEEVRLASAEAFCAESSGLSSVAKHLDAKYRTELRRRHPKDTADLTRLKREALPRARAILTRGD